MSADPFGVTPGVWDLTLLILPAGKISKKSGEGRLTPPRPRAFRNRTKFGTSKNRFWIDCCIIVDLIFASFLCFVLTVFLRHGFGIIFWKCLSTCQKVKTQISSVGGIENHVFHVAQKRHKHNLKMMPTLLQPGPYTHLTLPTNREVETCVVDVNLKKIEPSKIILVIINIFL